MFLSGTKTSRGGPHLQGPFRFRHAGQIFRLYLNAIGARYVGSTRDPPRHRIVIEPVGQAGDLKPKRISIRIEGHRKIRALPDKNLLRRTQHRQGIRGNGNIKYILQPSAFVSRGLFAESQRDGSGKIPGPVDGSVGSHHQGAEKILVDSAGSPSIQGLSLR